MVFIDVSASTSMSYHRWCSALVEMNARNVLRWRQKELHGQIQRYVRGSCSLSFFASFRVLLEVFELFFVILCFLLYSCASASCVNDMSVRGSITEAMV